MTQDTSSIRKLMWTVIFSVAFGFVEASVVVYLRALYYPGGFSFPLTSLGQTHLIVELIREAATIVMLIAVAVIAGKKGWQRFGYFGVAFGAWDLSFYLWLKAILHWPGSLTEWDILFLLPRPWIGPVIAPVAIALLLILCGTVVVRRTAQERYFHPRTLSWVLTIAGSGMVLYSFMSDTGATLHGMMPQPYRYELLLVPIVLYVVAFVVACRPARRDRAGRHG